MHAMQLGFPIHKHIKKNILRLFVYRSDSIKFLV